MPALVSVPISNEPGALSKVTQALAEGNVQIEGVNLVPRGDRGMANFLVREAAPALEALQIAGFSGDASDVHVVTLSNDQGALADMTQRLSRAGINIQGIFGTTYGSAGNLAVVTDDNPTARKVLDQLSHEVV